jgi:hypothetical protein
VQEDLQNDLLTTSITDDGRGMDAETAQRVVDPFYTTRTTRKVGLGIPLLKLAAEMAGGKLSLVTESGKGAKVEASFRHSHIDRMPLGDLASTFIALLVSHPKIHWKFIYQTTNKNGKSASFIFDDTELKNELGDMSITEPEILKFVRGMIEDGVHAPALQTIG